MAGQTMGEVMQAHPTSAQALLDFEISFGRLERGGWLIEQSTLPELCGTKLPLSLHKLSDARASVMCPDATSEWELLEWTTTDNALVFA